MNWKEWNGTTAISSTSDFPYVLYLRGNNTDVGGTVTDPVDGLILSAPAACSGNIMTLLNYSNPATVITSKQAFAYLFNGCSNLTSAPDLPATALTERCYSNMFEDCRSLINAPALPAKTLATACYMEMFSGCISLISAPELPATTLAPSCYRNMFTSCYSLTSAPSELPAKTLAFACYMDMFVLCTNLTSAPSLPATTLAD